MKSSVLIVDDDLQTAKNAQNLLWSGGYDVQTTIDGDAALVVLRNWSPSAIITDLQMARVDGVELCRRIAQDVEHAHHRRGGQSRRGRPR